MAFAEDIARLLLLCACARAVLVGPAPSTIAQTIVANAKADIFVVIGQDGAV